MCLAILIKYIEAFKPFPIIDIEFLSQHKQKVPEPSSMNVVGIQFDCMSDQNKHATIIIAHYYYNVFIEIEKNVYYH